MYDTLRITYPYADCNSIAKRLDHPKESIDRATGEVLGTSGRIGNLRAYVTAHGCLSLSGSLPKHHSGNSTRTMSLADGRECIRQLSDALSLPIEHAFVYRVDVAANLALPDLPSRFMASLGSLSRYRRLDALEDGSIYYKQKARELVFYDKTRETRKAQRDVAVADNLMRYELRLLRGVSEQVGVSRLTVGDLFQASTVATLVDRWEATYLAITKLARPELPNVHPTSWIGARDYLVSLGVESLGGEAAARAWLRSVHEAGYMGQTQHSRSRCAVSKACAIDSAGRGNEATRLLDRAVIDQATAFRDEAREL